MSTRQVRKLSEVIEFRNGLNFSEKNDGQGLPIIKVKDFGDNHFVKYHMLDEINPVGLKIGDGQLLQRNDIVLVRSNGNKDLVGRSMIYDGPNNAVSFAGFCIRGRVNCREASPQFIHYWLRSPMTRERFSREGAGTGIQNVSQGLLNSLLISLPPLAEQREIAATLGALDDKIVLNRKTAATLEEMARALYRSWFVDFDPVRARAEGRGPAHMDPTTAALFPDSFGEDGLPVGWKLGKLSDVAEVTMGQSPKGDTYNSEGHGTPLCNGPVEFGEYFLRQIKWTSHPSKLAIRGDLILCVRGSTTGRHAFADAAYCLGRGVAGIRGRNNYQEFSNQSVLGNIERLLEKATGSVFPNLSGKDIGSLEAIIPSKRLINEFCDVTQIGRDSISNLIQQNRTLATLRDTLLPRLMSGELRVGAAREMIAEVA